MITARLLDSGEDSQVCLRPEGDEPMAGKGVYKRPSSRQGWGCGQEVMRTEIRWFRVGEGALVLEHVSCMPEDRGWSDLKYFKGRIIRTVQMI